MELFVRVVDRLVVRAEHVVVDHAVRLGVHAGGHGEVVDVGLRGERVAHVRRRGGPVPEPGQVRRQAGPDVVGAETVERHDQHQRVPRDRGDRGDRDQGARDSADHHAGRTVEHRNYLVAGRTTERLEFGYPVRIKPVRIIFTIFDGARDRGGPVVSRTIRLWTGLKKRAGRTTCEYELYLSCERRGTSRCPSNACQRRRAR